MPEYRHTQIGYVILVPLVAVLVIGAFAAGEDGYDAADAAILLLIALVAAFFSALTVKIRSGVLTASFGPGLISRKIPLQDIESAVAVRVPWYVGWGIRWTGRYWLFNVSGRDAIVLHRRIERPFAVGTDEPETLLNALSRTGIRVER